MTPVQEILQHKGARVYSVAPQTLAAEAVAEMNRRKIGAVLVLLDSELVGIFTERDVLVRIVDAGLDPKATPVQQVMTPAPRTVAADISAKAAMRLMTDHRCRHLPVLDSGKVIGLVSIGDLLRWMVYTREHEIDELRHYITDAPASLVESAAS